MKDSNIEWTDHTFNPWIGCTKVSPGCSNCYAAAQDKFRGWTPEGWGAGKPRRRTSAANWKQPLKWDREAAAAGIRFRVFCSSLADWLDDEVPAEWLADLLHLIKRTPHLDWLLLTKRPQLWQVRMDKVRAVDGDSPAWTWGRHCFPLNVWVGTSVEDQTRAEQRIPQLLDIPARVRFLSCEPLLGPLAISTFFGPIGNEHGSFTAIDWVICGGESGPGARTMALSWARALRQDCQTYGVAFFMKQLGGERDKRGNLFGFPEDLRVRDFPEVRT